MKRILVLNLGSTSFKCKLYDMGAKETPLAEGAVENIGGEGRYRVRTQTREQESACACPTHLDALLLCVDSLARLGLPLEMEELDAVGFKAVHGGSRSGACLVDEELLAEMERMVPWAPAHNPVYLAMMRGLRDTYPQLTQIACFETSFHSSIPLERTVYGVPYEWVQAYGLRRYGFHGSSHSFIAQEMRRLTPECRRVICAHLGGSSSLCAILDGRSIATSMGATPQSGVFHNNRVGDLDVFCLPPLAEKLGGLDAVMEQLSRNSGFLGLCGVSNDLRGIQAAADAGNERAELSMAAFADAVVGYIGMYTAYLGGLDALVFTGGIGRNAPDMRRRIVQGLSFVGARLDDAANGSGEAGRLDAPESAIAIWALDTNEELMVARGCMQCLTA